MNESLSDISISSFIFDLVSTSLCVISNVTIFILSMIVQYQAADTQVHPVHKYFHGKLPNIFDTQT